MSQTQTGLLPISRSGFSPAVDQPVQVCSVCPQTGDQLIVRRNALNEVP